MVQRHTMQLPSADATRTPPSVEPSDEALARQSQRGDLDAFALLVARYQRTVFNVAYRMLGDAQDAEDVAQDVFLRAYQGLARYDAARPFFSWVYRIAVNRCLTLRERGRASTPLDDVAATLCDPARSPEQQTLDDEGQARLQQMIARLPDHERALIALRYDAELRYEEIATTLHLPLGTVKTRLFRARQHLAQLLQESDDDESS